MTAQPEPTVWPTLRYDDAPGAVRLLVEVFGFRAALVVPGDGDDVLHAELRWPEGGGVMLGSTKVCEGSHAEMKPGVNAAYVVTDDVDGVYARVQAAGTSIADELQDTDYGSHTFTARDHEGNLWSFGTYRGAWRSFFRRTVATDCGTIAMPAALLPRSRRAWCTGDEFLPRSTFAVGHGENPSFV